MSSGHRGFVFEEEPRFICLLSLYTIIMDFEAQPHLKVPNSAFQPHTRDLDIMGSPIMTCGHSNSESCQPFSLELGHLRCLSQ